MAFPTKLSVAVGALTLLVVLTGCSGDSSGGTSPRLLPTTSAPVTSGQGVEDVKVDDGERKGVLSVRFNYADETPLYAEGARHYVRLLNEAGDVVRVRDTGTEQGPGAGYKTRFSMAPGRYLVQTFQRGCDFVQSPDCEDVVGPRQGICELKVAVRPQRTTRVWLVLALPSECGLMASPLA